MQKFHISKTLLSIGCLIVLVSCSANDDKVHASTAILHKDTISPTISKNAYNILPGDILQITVWKEDGMDQEVLVLPDGTITFPLVGSVQTDGLTPADLQKVILNKLKTLIPDASATVNVKMPSGHKVSIIGQVIEPGEVIIYNEMSVMEALSQVGGLTAYADEGDIIIIRKNAAGKKEKIAFPYRAISKGRKLDQDINLQPGDVVVVPTSGLF